MIAPLQAVGFFILIAIGFYSGTLWVSTQQTLEINRLNSQIQTLENQLKTDFQKREILNQNIAAKNKTVEAFCKNWRK